MRFELVGINVSNLEKSKDFYTRVLGCKITAERVVNDNTLVFMDAHGTVLELLYNPTNQDGGRGPINHIAFRVADLDQEIADLNSKGISLTYPPLAIENGRIAFFKGPDGENIEYIELKE